MKIPFLDLSVKAEKRRLLLNAVEKVLSHGRIVLGPEVEQFERKVAEDCQVKYAVSVGSGTDALYLSLRSLDIGPGDEVITTPLSWIATLNSIKLCGATPVFVDIGEDLNIDENLIINSITKKTKAIIPVHFTGQLCRMDTILKIAKEHNIHVIEDAAQAYGASIDGRKAGSFGVVNAFSMNPMKVLGAYGEAGVVTTNNEDLYNKLISLRYAGTVNKEDCHFPSINGRIDTIQAAMLLVNRQYLEEKISRRREIARHYSKSLKGIVDCPKDNYNSLSVYYSYTIRTKCRDGLIEHLIDNNIETKIQHKILMPYHTAYRKEFMNINIPIAEKNVKEILCLPNHEDLTDIQVEFVIKCIREYFN